MTSKFVEIVPRPHLQGNTIPFGVRNEGKCFILWKEPR
jgi:hypothetical protein